MKYYLVAVFDKDSDIFMKEVQKSICKKYRLKDNNSIFYISLGVLINPDIKKLSSVISDVLKPYKYFKIKINKNLEFDSNSKTINLKVENKGYISRLSRNIDSELKSNGFKKEKDKSDLTINLCNIRNNFKKVQNLNCDNLDIIKKLDDPYITAKVSQLELWKIPNNKKRIIVKTFPLSEY